MIIDFSVQNFGSIKDKQTLSFEADKSDLLEYYYVIHEGKFRLLKLALIYGANASGKTTVLRALDFLRTIVGSPLDNKFQLLEFRPYLFDRVAFKQNSILSINFMQNNIHYFYCVEFNKNCIEREELNFYNPNKANIFTRTTDTKKQLSQITFGSKIKADKTFEKILTANTLWNTTVLGGFLKTNIDLKEIKEVSDWFAVYLSPMITPDFNLTSYATTEVGSSKFQKESIVSILKKADLNISDIIVDEGESAFSDDVLKEFEKVFSPDRIASFEKIKARSKGINLSFQHTANNLPYDLPFAWESQGTQRYFGLAAVLGRLIKESTGIPIDELESSLHPDLYIHFLLTFLANAKQSQLIATTHNREILDNKDIFRNDAIWFTDKSATGATELYSLADFDSSVVRDTSNVYNAYKTGKLGGVPNLGDYYIDLDK